MLQLFSRTPTLDKAFDLFIHRSGSIATRHPSLVEASAVLRPSTAKALDGQLYSHRAHKLAASQTLCLGLVWCNNCSGYKTPKREAVMTRSDRSLMVARISSCQMEHWKTVHAFYIINPASQNGVAPLDQGLSLAVFSPLSPHSFHFPSFHLNYGWSRPPVCALPPTLLPR